MGLPQKGQDVAAVDSSVIISPAQVLHTYRRIPSCSPAAHSRSLCVAHSIASGGSTCMASSKARISFGQNSESQKGHCIFCVLASNCTPPSQFGHLNSIRVMLFLLSCMFRLLRGFLMEALQQHKQRCPTASRLGQSRETSGRTARNAQGLHRLPVLQG